MKLTIILALLALMNLRGTVLSARKLIRFQRCAKAFGWPRPWRAAVLSWIKGDEHLRRRIPKP